MCIDIVNIWFRIANGQISSTFESFLLPNNSDWVLSFHVFIQMTDKLDLSSGELSCPVTGLVVY